MSYEAPWALLALLALPVLWWIHRHRRKPEIVPLPTLMFLLEEDERVHQPRKRRLDVETALAMLGAVLIAFAAAGPFFAQGSPAKRVRVVVAGGALATADGYAGRVEREIARIRDTGAQVEVRHVPPTGVAVAQAPRPSRAALLAEARAGSASVRVVIADRLPAEAPGDVRFIAVGDPDQTNRAIVAMRPHEVDGAPHVFVTVMVHPPASDSLTLAFAGSRHNVVIGPTGFGSISLPLPADHGDRRLGVEIVDANDACEADDRVGLPRSSVNATVSAGLPAATQRATRNAVRGAFPWTDRSGPEIRIGPSAEGPAIAIGVIGEGEAGVRAPRGAAVRIDDPVVEDLDPTGVTWVFAAGTETLAEGETLLLGLRAGDATWPIVTRRSDGTTRLVPDPSRGDPAALAAPFWPIFMHNAVWHAFMAQPGLPKDSWTTAVLDADTSQLGRDQRPFDPAWVAGAKADVPAPGIAFRTPLLVFALIVLLVLWLMPVLRRRAAAQPQPA